MNQKYNNLKGSGILLFTAFIWGMAFVAQTKAAEKGVTAFTFNAIRSFVGAGFLALLLFLNKAKTKQPIFPKEKKERGKLLLHCAICGIFLTLSVNLQQIGLDLYPAGVASEARGGFLTALYVVFVPATAVLFRRRVPKIVWLAVGVSMVGVYLLSLSGGISGIYVGDLLMIACGISFTGHILTVDRYGSGIDGRLLCCIQFLVCGVISSVIAFFTEAVTVTAVLDSAWEILYLGVCSSGIAYTLQIVGQRYADPPVASLSMSFESVFGALGGWIVRGTTLSGRELFGCCLMFVAIITAQLPDILPQIFNRKKTS